MKKLVRNLKPSEREIFKKLEGYPTFLIKNTRTHPGGSIPMSKVCDFFPDCAVFNPHDNSDEQGCDWCDFERGWCRKKGSWKDTSPGPFKWKLVQGHKDDNSSGPSVDHTTGETHVL